MQSQNLVQLVKVKVGRRRHREWVSTIYRLKLRLKKINYTVANGTVRAIKRSMSRLQRSWREVERKGAVSIKYIVCSLPQNPSLSVGVKNARVKKLSK